MTGYCDGCGNQMCICGVGEEICVETIIKERDEYKAKVEVLECICPSCEIKAEKKFELYDGYKVYILYCEGCGMSWFFFI